MQLTVEQQNFINSALSGKNVLVDACVGSGKTTAIQQLCMAFPKDKRVLYLTYNRLLKIDAKEKIKGRNITVTNYHGFAFSCLMRNGIKAGTPDMIQMFLSKKPSVGAYDLLVLDEYQDIDQEISEMLTYIKENNPGIQIVAVGDMKQKIYDKTTLDVQSFIDGFLGERDDLEFTQCFRLSKDIAAMLGRVWKKKIIGVNPECKVFGISENKIVEFLAEQQPKDILCLGARTGLMSRTLNILEDKYRSKFNKKTVYASISDNDRSNSTEPSKDTAIFTTFDSSKGMERKICVVFDFTESYWEIRRNKPEQKYEILRNIFCVAASRGKSQIVFVGHKEAMLTEKSLSTSSETYHKLQDMSISEMFDFKYIEDIEECYRLLDIRRVDRTDTSVIRIQNHEALIDLAPCIGKYQEASFFEKYDIDKDIELYKRLNPDKEIDSTKYKTLDEKILYYISLKTGQRRYITQVNRKIVEDEQKDALEKRLLELFTKQDNSQDFCIIKFASEKDGALKFSAIGYADVIKNKTVYELKFVSELTHEHFLQCACYVVAKKLEKGVLWNTRNNVMFEIMIPDKDRFLDCVVKTITKHRINQYHKPKRVAERFAVIDTETNWENEVMSVGIVIAEDGRFEAIDDKYIIFDEAARVGGLYSDRLVIKGQSPKILKKNKAIAEIKEYLNSHGVKLLFAYNASFDARCLPELCEYKWHDILKIAAYRQYNPAIPANAKCCTTGRLKSGYKMEDILRMFGENGYFEMHNALTDAIDELRIMNYLNYSIYEYPSTLNRSHPYSGR